MYSVSPSRPVGIYNHTRHGSYTPKPAWGANNQPQAAATSLNNCFLKFARQTSRPSDRFEFKIDDLRLYPDSRAGSLWHLPQIPSHRRLAVQLPEINHEQFSV